MAVRRAIAQYEATVVLVMISLALASVVYDGLRRGSDVGPTPSFVSEETLLVGDPAIDRVTVNSSSSTSITSVTVDSATSAQGIIEYGPSGYTTTTSLCTSGATTFFSVLAAESGTLAVATNGKAWISGQWASAAQVSAGWQEVMIAGGSSCSVTLPGGGQVPSQWEQSSQVLSSIPVEGATSGTAFTLYLPLGGGSNAVLFTFTGGIYSVSL